MYLCRIYRVLYVLFILLVSQIVLLKTCSGVVRTTQQSATANEHVYGVPQEALIELINLLNQIASNWWRIKPVTCICT